MLQPVLYTIISVILVSLVSLIGVVSLFFKQEKLNRILTLLVSLSAGSLLGGAFFHLLPEVVEQKGFPLAVPLSIIGGILLFFAVEKFIHWRHCHYSTTDSHPHHLALMNLVGDAVHNFLDGMIIAASYLASIPAGIATTIAVLVHEVPQEIGDFGVLLYSGWSKSKALMFNFFSALIAVVGAVVGLILGTSSESFVALILPLAAGGFIYIAGTDLMPELHKSCYNKETFWKESLWPFLAMVVGIGLMLALTLVE
ncbi:ZIP family metal transporter [Candidatus Woesearchaeota archaeon]|nr:ZIP family metal transporter [Candidatus Woesearchaeota archaeon]